MSDQLLMRLRGQRYDGHTDLEAMQLAADEIERLRGLLARWHDCYRDGLTCDNAEDMKDIDVDTVAALKVTCDHQDWMNCDCPNTATSDQPEAAKR